MPLSSMTARPTGGRGSWGFLEAEGAFFWMTFQKGKYGPYYYPRVGAGSTDQDVVERLQRYTGIGQITGPYSREPHKTVWYWTVTNRRDAVALMEAMYPYMGERRRAKIDEVLTFTERERQQRLIQPRIIRLKDLHLEEDGGLVLRRTA